MELKKLLYAVDLEDAPHPAIEHVKMVASLTGASVSIVYVLPSETVYESNYLSGEGQPNRIAPTQALLEKMEHFLNTNFPEGVDDCAFLMGKISEEVVKYAHKSDIDCIVGFRQLFAGSVATEVVKKAHCSVSVIRPRY
ncbi:universal stress protein [uncultured Bilophila sp.]|uniref:universal stress protein n=1 Tax=uncultured Bilophila sp. TaxID=529385 RepID=UPI0025933937|nr:universal stress protein [uncultured Bilophila sp.]